MDFSERLKELLKSNDMSQSDLCKKTGIASSLMANYCSGKRSPALTNAMAIADAFNITLDDLVGRTDEYTMKKKSETLVEDINNSGETTQIKKEPKTEIGSFEWLEQGLISRGVIKDGEDLTEEQLKIMLANLDSLVSVFNQHNKK